MATNAGQALAKYLLDDDVESMIQSLLKVLPAQNILRPRCKLIS